MNLAASLPDDLRAGLRQMLPQLLIALVQRAGGEISVPVTDIDATGDVNLLMDHDAVNNAFRFRVVAKDGGRQ